MLYVGEQILASAKLYAVQSLISGLKKITLKLLYLQAKYDIDNYTTKNEKFDLRTIPARIKNLILHDQDIIDKRWEICSGCEFLTGMNRCEKCGCFMKVKTRISEASCPIGLWGKEQIKDKIDVVTAT